MGSMSPSHNNDVIEPASSQSIDIASFPVNIPKASHAGQFRTRPGGFGVQGFGDTKNNDVQRLLPWGPLADRPVSAIIHEANALSSTIQCSVPARYHDVELAVSRALRRGQHVIDPTLGSEAGAWAFSLFLSGEINKGKYLAFRTLYTCATFAIQYMTGGRFSGQRESELIKRWNAAVISKLKNLEEWAQSRADSKVNEKVNVKERAEEEAQEWRNVVMAECLEFLTSIIYDDEKEFEKYKRSYSPTVMQLTLRVSKFVADCAPWPDFLACNKPSHEYGTWDIPYSIAMLSEMCDQAHSKKPLLSLQTSKPILSRLIKYERGIFNCWRRDILVPRLKPLGVLDEGGLTQREASHATVEFEGGHKMVLVFSDAGINIPHYKNDDVAMLQQGGMLAASLPTHELKSFAASESQMNSGEVTFGQALRFMGLCWLKSMRAKEKVGSEIDFSDGVGIELELSRLALSESEKETLQFSRCLDSAEDIEILADGENPDMRLQGVRDGVECVRELYGSILIYKEPMGVRFFPNKNLTYWVRALIARFPIIKLKGVSVGPFGATVGIMRKKEKKLWNLKQLISSFSSNTYTTASSLEMHLERNLKVRFQKKQGHLLSADRSEMPCLRENLIIKSAAVISRSLIERALATSQEFKLSVAGSYSHWSRAYRPTNEQRRGPKPLPLLYDADRVHVALLNAHYKCSKCSRHLLHFTKPVTVLLKEERMCIESENVLGGKMEFRSISESSEYSDECPCGIDGAAYDQKMERVLLLG